MRKRNASFISSLSIACLCASLVVHMRPSLGAPQGAINATDPLKAAPTEKTRDIGVGDMTVASRTGAFEYTYPVTIVPGRLGVQPSIALNYSSQGALRGGIAAGWTLAIPEVKLTFPDGRTEPGAYVSSMSGGHRLVETSEPVYSDGSVSLDNVSGSPYSPSFTSSLRSEYDDQYIRYSITESSTAAVKAVAMTSDGTIHFFGETSHIAESTTSTALDATRWPLTTTIDKFGNRVEYRYRGIGLPGSTSRMQEFVLDNIEYGRNDQAGIGNFAKVEFDSTLEPSCPSGVAPPGASLNHRWEHLRSRGAEKLNAIRTFVKDTPSSSYRPVRVVALGYDSKTEGCHEQHGPLRMLTSLQEYAPIEAGDANPGDFQVGDWTSRPPITFDYGPLTRVWNATGSATGLISIGGGTRMSNETGVFNGHKWPSLDDMLLDFNGDGIVDRLSAEPAVDADSGCQMTVHLRDGSGASVATTHDLPSIPWRNSDNPSTSVLLPDETCSLNGQRTFHTTRQLDSECSNGGSYFAYRFLDMDADGLPDLITEISADTRWFAAWDPNSGIDGTDLPPLDPTEFGFCPLLSPELLATAEITSNDQEGRGYYSFDQEAIQDLYDAADTVPCGALYMQPHPHAGPVPEFGVLPCPLPGACNDAGIIPDGNDCPHSGVRGPQLHNGKYVWHWWKNEGGTLSSTRQTTLSPIPLNSNSGDSSLGHGPLVSSPQTGLFDINGDGFIDAISIDRTPSDLGGDMDPLSWFVWPGDGSGTFAGTTNGHPIAWHVPVTARPSRGGADKFFPIQQNSDADYLVNGTATMQDVNNDGLVDLLMVRGDGTDAQVAVYLNHGMGFRSGSISHPASNPPPITVWPYRLPASGEAELAATSFSVTDDTDDPGASSSAFITNALRKSRLSIADIDGDGIPDVRSEGIERSPSSDSTYFGSADGRLLKPIATSFDAPRRGVAGDHLDWTLEAEYMDFDGDGVVDQLTKLTPLGTPGLSTTDFEGKPMRLMISVNNGNGLTSEIRYAPQNDPSVAADSQEGKGMPSHAWVVSDVTRTDSVGGITNVAEVKYGDPVWNKDAHDRYGFRGFETIETSALHQETATSGFSVTAQTYDYDIDWSGRVVETTVYVDGFPASDGSSMVASIEKTTLVERAVMNDLSLSYAPSRVRGWNCEMPGGGFQDYNSCSATVPTNEQRYWNSYYSAYGSGGQPVLSLSYQDWKAPTGSYTSYTKTDSILRRGVYRAYSTSSFYRLAQTSEILYEGTEGDGAAPNYHNAVSHRQFLQDPDDLYDRVTTQFTDSQNVNSLFSRTERDTTLGHVVYEERPEHYGTGIQTTYSYDGFKVTAASVTTPPPNAGALGHTTNYETDLGIGTTTRTESPNTISCGGSTGPEGGRSIFDGFGRPLDVYAFGCVDASTYGEYRTKHYDYTEFSVGTPASVLETTFLNITGTQAVISETYYDGFGRIASIRQELDVGNATTLYEYGVNGKVARVRAPNPQHNLDSSKSEVTYRYDTLGRLVGTRIASGVAPDPQATNWDAYVGTDISYGFDGGRTKTVSEHVLDNSPAAETTTYSDFFGQLVRVDETTTAGSATTYYHYDGNGNLDRIIDADMHETIMEHDKASRRTKIMRGGRTWSFEYDRNGNVVLETSPVPSGANTVDYQTSYAYDDLDRVTSVVAAPRDLSAPDQSLFGSAATVSSYDGGFNAIGRLTNVSGPFHGKSYSYDDAGRVSQEVLDFDHSGQFSGLQDTLVRQTTYNAAGMPTEVTTPDGKVLKYEYDAVGRPSKVIWDNSNLGPAYEVASFERNVAGQIVHQESACLSRDWEYDYLGRTTETEVYKDPAKDCGTSGTGLGTGNGLLCPSSGGWQSLQETMTYYDSSEVQQLIVDRPCVTSRTFDFTYDTQHQLVAASNPVAGYSADFAFTGAGRVLSANVVGTEQALVRDVNYEYGDEYASSPVDAHAVKALTDRITNKNVVAYSHDAAGNVTKRVEGASSFDFSYDGADQQRRAKSSSGNEELYYYDDAGHRYLAVERTQSGGSVIRSRVWFGDTEYWYDNKGAVSKKMTNLSLGASSVARIDNQNGQDELEFSFHNGLGHLMAAVGTDAEVNAAYLYGPFGEVLEESGEVDTHLRRFNGKEADQLSRLNYYGYRYYDPLSLTWTQADPLFRLVPDLAYDQPRLMSLYAFSLNNPVQYVDPDGRLPVAAGCAVAPTACAAAGTAIVKGAAFVASAAVVAVVAIWATDTIDMQQAAAQILQTSSPTSTTNTTTTTPTTDTTTTTPTTDTTTATPTTPTADTTTTTPTGNPNPKTSKPKEKGTKKPKKARDSGKSERHGDNGRALNKAADKIANLQDKLKNASGKEAKKIKQKIQNITKDALKKRKGETHWK